MFKNKNSDGTLNICGKMVAKLRKESNMSQRALADKLQLLGVDLNKNAIQQIECGQRFVTDIELKTLAAYFKTTTDQMLDI